MPENSEGGKTKNVIKLGYTLVMFAGSLYVNSQMQAAEVGSEQYNIMFATKIGILAINAFIVMYNLKKAMESTQANPGGSTMDQLKNMLMAGVAVSPIIIDYYNSMINSNYPH